MRWLITGCRGFIGGSLGRHLAARGDVVLGVGRSSQPDARWPGEYSGADVAQADLAPLIRDFAPDVIFHAAGSASVGASFAGPHDDLRATVQSFSNTLDSARRAGSHPLILFPSSAAVYGNPASLPVGEDAALAPVSPYGFHKVMCESLARQYATCFGLRVVIGRLFSVFGPLQRRLLVWEIHKQLVTGSPSVVLEGSGEETRDYLAIEDVAEAFAELARVEAPSHATPEVVTVNIASGTPVAIMELARTVAAVHGSDAPVRCLGRIRPGDPLHWHADTRALRGRCASFQPRSLEQGLRECVQAWRTQTGR